MRSACRLLMPYGNHAAKATYTRGQLEMGQLVHELNATLKRVTVEVENSLRDIDAARVSIDGNRESLEAAAAELDYLLDRWPALLPGEDRLSSLLLDERGALARLVAAESAFAQSELDYALSITRYKRAAGMLIQTHPIAPERAGVNHRRARVPASPRRKVRQPACRSQEVIL